METVAVSKSVKISPRKVRLVASAISNMPVEKALQMLLVTKKRSSEAIAKTVKSALSNAVHNAKANKDSLFIKKIEVSQGVALKRFHPSTRGRVHPYKKRSSHIKVTVEEKK